jgi:hypothetical protein
LKIFKNLTGILDTHNHPLSLLYINGYTLILKIERHRTLFATHIRCHGNREQGWKNGKFQLIYISAVKCSIFKQSYCKMSYQREGKQMVNRYLTNVIIQTTTKFQSVDTLITK